MIKPKSEVARDLKRTQLLNYKPSKEAQNPREGRRHKFPEATTGERKMCNSSQKDAKKPRHVWGKMRLSTLFGASLKVKRFPKRISL